MQYSCTVCGNLYISKRPPRISPVCSNTCSMVRWKVLNREKYLASRAASRAKIIAARKPKQKSYDNCDFCGDRYERIQPIQKFCSRQCYATSYRTRNKDRLTERRHEKIARRKEYYEAKAKYYHDQKHFSGNRLAAIKRDEFSCRECGFVSPDEITSKGQELVVHHIDFSGNSDTPNNRIENLQTLCRACHIRIHTHEVRKTT